VVAVALVVNVTHVDWRLGIDFHTYYAATKVALGQGWSHLYDQAIIAQTQKELVPAQWSQPFLSPPTVAWLTAPLSPLPYRIAFLVWAAAMFLALALALAWAGTGRGLGRWIAVFGALSTWWVMHAVDVGQVVPLVAASTVVAWRLIRDKHDIAAGLVLAAILLKPNTAILVPFALLLAGRLRAFAAWLGAAVAILILAYITLGANGMATYIEQLMAPLPRGADALTLHGAFGAAGAAALVLRLVILGATLATAYRLRGTPQLVIPAAIIGSLLVAPYLHGADMCLFAAAGWMIWEAHPRLAWRIPLGAAWVLASPFLYVFNLALPLYRWPWLELALLGALVVSAWGPLTRWADVRTQAPA
jgi:glycosyl transferase family 87